MGLDLQLVEPLIQNKEDKKHARFCLFFHILVEISTPWLNFISLLKKKVIFFQIRDCILKKVCYTNNNLN